MLHHKFYQYPRGDNRGGLIAPSCSTGDKGSTVVSPTITLNSWQHNCFLVLEYD